MLKLLAISFTLVLVLYLALQPLAHASEVESSEYSSEVLGQGSSASYYYTPSVTIDTPLATTGAQYPDLASTFYKDDPFQLSVTFQDRPIGRYLSYNTTYAVDEVSVTYGGYYKGSSIYTSLPRVTFISSVDYDVSVTYTVYRTSDTEVTYERVTLPSFTSPSTYSPSRVFQTYLENRLAYDEYATDVTFVYTSPDAVFTSFNVLFPTANEYTSANTSPDLDAIFDAGYDTGYEEGFNGGYDGGYTAGVDAGRTEGYDSGYDEGYQAGLDDGDAAGFDRGAGFNSIEWLLRIGDAALGFELIPSAHITVGTLIGVMLGIPLLIWFLKLFAGG